MVDYDINIIFSNNLKFYMDRKSVTQEDLANYLGVSQVAVSSWCRGIKMPRMNKIDKLCAYFSCKRSDLIEDGVKSHNKIDKVTDKFADENFSEEELENITTYINFLISNRK